MGDGGFVQMRCGAVVRKAGKGKRKAGKKGEVK